MEKNAILVVSFGTTHEDTRIRTIEGIENHIREMFPDRRVYRAWTSSIIRKILLNRDQIRVDSVEEAMERMLADGVTDVIIQPTHVINGIENDRMREAVSGYMDRFGCIRIGAPLLTTEADFEAVAEILGNMFMDVPKDEAVVLMGHGTEHQANNAYSVMEHVFKKNSYDNFFMGTVESHPSLDTVKEIVDDFHPKKIHLMPFMIVAGDHAKNDMAGDDKDSWKSQFEQMGYHVECHLAGLGENKRIQDMFAKHVREVG